MGIFREFENVQMIAYHEKKQSNNTFYHFIYRSSIHVGVIHLLLNRHNDSLFVIKSTNEYFKGIEEHIEIDKLTIFELFDEIHNTTGFLCYNDNRFIIPYPDLVVDGVNGLIVKEQAYFDITP